jgi:ABC-2 type transport system ATP-binding protein
MENIIHIDMLNKSYGKNRGIIDISMDVKKGDIFGFLGPNGAGKSTTIRSLLGLIKINSGNATIFDLDIKTKSKEIINKIGYMPSEAMFYPSMKVSEIIKFAADVRGIDATLEASKLCERLKVDTKKRIDELSLGNRKKVSIVCAMQHKPELFIFDEPTSGLDPLMQTEFFKLVKEYNEAGTTCLLSSHVLSEVRQYCNKAAIIKDGRIVCIDSIEKLAHTDSKKIKIEGMSKDDIEASQLSGISGVLEEKLKDATKLEFTYQGDINKLIKTVAGKTITNISIEEPSLEDVFMHYYGEVK